MIYYIHIFIQEIKYICTNFPCTTIWVWCPSARYTQYSPKPGTVFSRVRSCAFVLSAWYHYHQSRKVETETYRDIRRDDPKKTILIVIEW